MKDNSQRKIERNEQALQMRENGATYREIAEKFSISTKRAVQIVNKTKARLKTSQEPTQAS